MIPQPRGRTTTATLPIRSECALKLILSASTTKYKIILPEMRRQTLRKPCSSTRHHHRSSTLTNAIQMRQKKKTPSYYCSPCCSSLSVSRFFLFSHFRMLMILITQLQKGLSKAALQEPKRPSSIQCHEERERERASERARQAPFASERARERGRSEKARSKNGQLLPAEPGY